ncbi:Mannosyltransferase (PIG-V) [Streptacidiphilus jiangxiensis]|uniref:Mannosyltransferase (PIG-V) n=2 Tax=Streptacidiphilus jiangxiensis TaxID=235985 RepID=A0A1H8ABL2_STRJI|nr:Mannosyltransferase (PIG-V) [Streptacidiphilus jiangxiensis]
MAPVRRLPIRLISPERRAALAMSLQLAEPALLLFLVVRAAGLSLILLLSPGSPSYALHRLAVHWDAAWYLDVAMHGYDHAIRPWLPGAALQTTNLAFFPVFPWMIRTVHTLLPFVPWGVASLLTASLCALGAALGIFAAVNARYGDKVARMAVVLWGIAPVAAVETAGYSESAFTLMAAWTLYAVVTRRWLTAGVLSVLAGLTRPTGVAVAAAVMAAGAMELWVRLRERRAPGMLPGRLSWLDRLPWFDGADVRAVTPVHEPELWRPLAAIVLAPLGWVGFVAWTGWRLHTWDAYFRIQALWHSKFDFGKSTAHDFKLLFTNAEPVGLYYPVVAGILVAAAVLFFTTIAQRQPLGFVVFTLVTMVIAFGDTAYFASRARFLLPAFPLLIPIAAGLVRVRTRATLVTALIAGTLCSGLYGAYLLLYSPAAP